MAPRVLHFRVIYVLILPIFWFLQCSDVVSSEQSGELPLDWQEFDDWLVICSADTDNANDRSCRMLQSHKISNEEDGILAVSVVYDSKKKMGFGVMSLPSGVYLAPDIKVTVDQGKSFRVIYEYCGVSGCHAGFMVGEDVLSTFKRGRTATVRFWFGVANALDVEISLIGFTAAFNRLKELA